MNRSVSQIHSISREEKIIRRDGLSFVSYRALEETGLVAHGFSTRLGGVSEGCYDSLDLSYARGDNPQHVAENFRRAAAFFDLTPEHMVYGHQTHTNHVLHVTKEDAGKGITRERDYHDIDGLITDEPGLMLMTSHADCTPVFFVDERHPAIGMAHSGWKGTELRMAASMIRSMHEAFGTHPEDLLCVIGPCACGACYEVGPEVVEIFLFAFGKETLSPDPPAYEKRTGEGSKPEAVKRNEIPYGEPGSGYVLQRRKNGRYLFDQKAANRRILLECGVLKERIIVSGLCTMERTDLFYSHRKMGNARGNMGAFLMLRESTGGLV